MLAFLLFMMAVFAGGGMANGNSLSERQTLLLDLSLLALPASAVLGAGVVICLYVTGAGPSSYGWYSLPAAAVALYALFVSSIKR